MQKESCNAFGSQPLHYPKIVSLRGVCASVWICAYLYLQCVCVTLFRLLLCRLSKHVRQNIWPSHSMLRCLYARQNLSYRLQCWIHAHVHTCTHTHAHTRFKPQLRSIDLLTRDNLSVLFISLISHFPHPTYKEDVVNGQPPPRLPIHPLCLHLDIP